MAYEHTPAEMRDFAQWVVWRYEEKQSGKPTKVPYSPVSHRLANVTDPQTWGTFDQAVQAAAAPNMYTGIGFVLTQSDPFAFIDLDDTKGNAEALERQRTIYNQFDSYAERSPSGKGLHIIVKGSVPAGRRDRNNSIEVYSSQRYMTMTGNVFRDAPIRDMHDKLSALWAQFGHGNVVEKAYAGMAEQTHDDATIWKMANEARNGEKFTDLWNGNWSKYYTSQSEGDLALIDILAFYTQNRAQIQRLFRQSGLGQREKAQRQGYVNYMLNKCFDRMLPLVDVSGALHKLQPVIPNIGPASFSPISEAEWMNARLSPDIIVDNYLYADVSILVAPGGVGKTTLALYEAIHIVLGLELYGRTIRKPGKVVIVTAEDSRELMIARLRRIALAMQLPLDKQEFIANNTLIEYVGNHTDFRLCQVVRDSVVNSPYVDQLISVLKPLNPVYVILDPTISFGIGESRVNDAEQGLIRATRCIRDALECCVRLIHHTGKENARNGDITQYAGRGGSTMPDGARMVTVVKSLGAEEWRKETGEELSENAQGLVLSLAKLSFTPKQPNIYVERKGFAYRHVKPTVTSVETVETTILEYLKDEIPKGNYHSQNAVETTSLLPFSRIKTRNAIKGLIAAGKVVIENVPGDARRKYLRVVEQPSLPSTSNPPIIFQPGLLDD